MAGYEDFPLLPGAAFVAAHPNALREALVRRAAQSGDSITPPATINATDPVEGAGFKTWLLAARTAVEVMLTAESYYAHGSVEESVYDFAPWTLANLMTYIHTNFISVEGGESENAWKPYSEVAPNSFKVAYINEIYYACECMCITNPGLDDGSRTGTVKAGAGSSLHSGGGGHIADEELGPLVAGNEQEGTCSKTDITESSLYIEMSQAEPYRYLELEDDGVGGFNVLTAINITFSYASTINYATGEIYIATTENWVADESVFRVAYDYEEAIVPGSLSTAISSALSDFDGGSYGAGTAEVTATRHYREDPPGSYDYYADVENHRMTSDPVVVPDVAYSLSVLAVPFRETYELSAPGVVFSGSGFSVAKRLAPEITEVWLEGFIRVVKDSGGWDNESVSIGYWFDDDDLSGIGGWFVVGSECSDSIYAEILDLDSFDGYGQTDFGGYHNGEYGM